MKTVALFSIVIFLITSCSKDTISHKALYISTTTVITGVIPSGTQECIQARENENDPWRPFCYPIEGFVYEKDHEYYITVKIIQPYDRQPPEDGTNIRYVLDRVIRK